MQLFWPIKKVNQAIIYSGQLGKKITTSPGNVFEVAGGNCLIDSFTKAINWAGDMVGNHNSKEVNYNKTANGEVDKKRICHCFLSCYQCEVRIASGKTSLNSIFAELVEEKIDEKIGGRCDRCRD